MPTPRKRTKFGAAAEQAIRNTVDLVDEAGRAYEDLEAAEAAVITAREAYRTRYQSALEGGWTKEQLANLDEPLPAPKATRAARKPAKVQPPTAPVESGESESTGAGEVSSEETAGE